MRPELRHLEGHNRGPLDGLVRFAVIVMAGICVTLLSLMAAIVAVRWPH